MKEKITDEDLDLILGKKVSNSSANFDAKVKKITIKQPTNQSKIIDFLVTKILLDVDFEFLFFIN